jgi:hypothetical protein
MKSSTPTLIEDKPHPLLRIVVATTIRRVLITSGITSPEERHSRQLLREAGKSVVDLVTAIGDRHAG